MGLAAFNRCYVVPTIKVWGKPLYGLGVSANSLEVFNKKCMVHNIEGLGEVLENCSSKTAVIKTEVCCQRNGLEQLLLIAWDGNQTDLP